jgi:hypothetical protein
VGAILRLNEGAKDVAGLAQDGSSISKGVEVLSAVSKEINVFMHLLENPRSLDRSAEETANTASTEGSRGSPSPANHNGKARAKTSNSRGQANFADEPTSR